MVFCRTIKFRILSVCLCLSLLMTSLLGFVLYTDVKQSYIRQDIRYSGYNMKMVMNNIDRDYSQIVNYLLWLSGSREVTRFLNMNPVSNAYSAARVAAFSSCQKQMLSMSLSGLVDKCVVSSLDGSYFVVGRNNGDPSDHLQIAGEDPATLSPNIRVGAFRPSPFRYGAEATGIMLTCGIYNQANQLIGSAHLFVTADILGTQLARYLAGEDGGLFLDTENGCYPVENGRLAGFPQGDTVLSGLVPVDGEGGVYTAGLHQGGKAAEAVAVGSSLTGWRLVKLLPAYTAGDISAGLGSLLFAMGAIVFGCFTLMMLALIRLINRPVARIIRRVGLVATGDFARDPAIETDDELGTIGRGINSMSADIQKLIAAHLEEQQQKKNYEFKVLQTQINPHFLYNTLSSIKWMASIQKAQGIAEMSSTLGHMLRLIAQVNDEIIPLDKELEFVRDYAVIQSYRYGDTFTVEYDVEDPALLAARVIKFTLQPLVENALFHGIEPKNMPGVVRIRARRQGEDLLLSVTDDGVGMAAETVERLGRFSRESEGERNTIGLANIHHRIQLEYGEDYGLAIESDPGRFTTVTIRIPHQV